MTAAVSRTRASLKNSTVALVFYFINLTVQFFSRKVFLEYLGTEVLGLNATANNLLQFLSIAELGIGSAVGFCLYKPLYDGDTRTVKEVVALQGKMYRKIAFIIIAGAIALMFFFPYIFKKMELPLWYAYASFSVLLYGSLLGYFVSYKQVVLSASQQDYKTLYSFRTVNIIKSLVQMYAVSNFRDGYICWLVLEVVFSTLGALSLHLMTVWTFPYLKESVNMSFRDLRVKYPVLTKKIGQVFFHRIGSFAVSESSPVIIYAYTNLSIVALYGNYLLITQGIDLLSRAVFNGINASIGSLVAEGNMEKIRKTFDELFSLRFMLVTTVCVGIYILAPSFITLWIGKGYLLADSTLLLMVLMLYNQLLRLAVESFSFAYGLYDDIGAPVVETVLSIGLSVIGGYYYGLNGILGGAIISQIMVGGIWKPYYLFHKQMKGYGAHFISLYFKHICILVIVVVLFIFLNQFITFSLSINWGWFILGAFIKVLVFLTLMAGFLLFFRMPLLQFLVRLKVLAK